MHRTALLALTLGAFALGPLPAAAAPVAKPAAPLTSDLSSQTRRAAQPPTRFRVHPGRRLLYRDCDFKLVQQYRPSGTVIVPWQRCWWVRG